MKKSLTAVVLSVPMLLSLGCVAQSKYDELDQAYRKTLEQVTERDARIAELEAQIAALRAGPEADKARIAELMAERDRLMKELEDLNTKFGNIKFQEHIALPGPVDAALREWAAQNPDLVEYDAARGMVKFRSDITFRLGSAELNPSAKAAIGRFAQILNAPEIRNYEAMVIGHTDSVPIRREATKEQHPTNWHLSAHRAISVRDAIEQAGVTPVRTSVAGYSFYRPVVQNTRTGAEPNRRVEVYIRPMTTVNEAYIGASGAAAPAPRAPAPAPAPARVDDIPLK